MRKFLISLLLASAAATPALAAPRDNSDRDQARAERQQAREDRQAARDDARSERAAPAPRVDRVAPAERPQFAPQAAGRPDRPQPAYSGGQNFRPDPATIRAEQDARRESFDAARGQRVDQRQQLQDQLRADREQRIDQMRANRDWRQSTRPVPPVMRTPSPVVSNTPRPGTQPPLREVNRPGPAPQWSTSWRNNNHYDWQNYRHHHRSLFHLGFYYDPFGWGYQPYQIGWRLWPSYYGRNYWIDDPWMYRLPYAPPGYQWIRYWNDAVLVDTWTGEVVDVIPGFFW